MGTPHFTSMVVAKANYLNFMAHIANTRTSTLHFSREKEKQSNREVVIVSIRLSVIITTIVKWMI
jgi:hypothetical protein